MKKDSEILICGAGLEGLLLALKFAQAGLELTRVDSKVEINDSPRACVYGPASMEGFDSIGLYEDIKKVSHINASIGFRSKDHEFFMTSKATGTGPYDRNFHAGQEHIEKAKGRVSSSEAQQFIMKLAYLTIGDPMLKNSPWQKYKDASSLGLAMLPNA